jgi:hypothetical protein
MTAKNLVSGSRDCSDGIWKRRDAEGSRYGDDGLCGTTV